MERNTNKMNNQTVYNPFNIKNRLFTKQDIQAILNNVNFKVRDTCLYQTSMIHSSYVKRVEYISPSGEQTQLADRPDHCLDLFDNSYERLEHLGDSVLGVVVSSYLLKRFPHENEGFLTNLKKEIVCNDMLGTLSQKIGLDRFYVISKHNEEVCNGRTNTKKLGDILEAFIGALWVDSDYDFKVVYSFIIGLVETYINIPKILMNNRNYKEQLQKIYQGKFHHTPTYLMVSSSANLYTMSVLDKDGLHIGTGTAPTKKQAEQLAAKHAMDRMTA
jgi:ribonuclease-3